VTTGSPVQLSDAEAVPVAAGSVLAVHSMVRFGGQVMVGGALSSTTIVCTHELLFSHSSIAVQVRVIVYSFIQMPLAVTSL
jgi:hypothetical protein